MIRLDFDDCVYMAIVELRDDPGVIELRDTANTIPKLIDLVDSIVNHQLDTPTTQRIYTLAVAFRLGAS